MIPKPDKYISQDPIGYLGEDYNLYRYVRKNPINKYDLLGLDSVAIYWYSHDDANFEAAALSKAKEHKNAGDTVTVSCYSGSISPNSDIVYIYSHGNESGPNGYGLEAVAMALGGLPQAPTENDDFINVNKEIHFMGCNIDHDFESTTKDNESFAKYLSDHLSNHGSSADVHAAETGSRVVLSSPSGKYSLTELQALMSGPKSNWKNAIACGDLKVDYVPWNGSYTKF